MKRLTIVLTFSTLLLASIYPAVNADIVSDANACEGEKTAHYAGCTAMCGNTEACAETCGKSASCLWDKCMRDRGHTIAPQGCPDQ